jgi:Fe-S oxidoreductase
LFDALFDEAGGVEPLPSRISHLASLCSLCGRCTLVCPYQNGKLETKSLIRPVLALKGAALREEQKGIGRFFERLFWRELPLFLDLARLFGSISNALISKPFVRRLLGRMFDLDPKASLPSFSRASRFQCKPGQWGLKLSSKLTGQKFAVFDSCLTRAFFPDEAQKACALIEGFGGDATRIQKGCCGMVALERGLEAFARKRYQRPLLKRFQRAKESGFSKVLFLEPTCLFALLTFPEELQAFGIEKTDLILASDFLSQVLENEHVHEEAQSKVVYQPPCSHDSQVASGWLKGAFESGSVQTLEGTCCGMQGSLGFRKSAREDRERFAKRFSRELRAQKNALWIHDCSLCLILARSIGEQRSTTRLDILWEMGHHNPTQTKEAIS